MERLTLRKTSRYKIYSLQDCAFSLSRLPSPEHNLLTFAPIAFADTVKIDLEAANDEEEPPFIKYTVTDRVNVRSLQQKKARHYNVKGSSYLLEIAKVYLYTPLDANPNPLRRNQYNLGAGRGHFSVSVFRNEWATILSANADLGIGEGVRWKPDLETFFPDEKSALPVKDRGFSDFLKGLDEGAKLIYGRESELQGDAEGDAEGNPESPSSPSPVSNSS